MNSCIKVLILDADKVIFEKISPVFIKELNRLTGLDVEQINEKRKKYWRLLKTGKITDRQMWLGAKKLKGYEQGLFGELGISRNNYAPFIEKIRASYRMNKGALRFIKQAKAKGITLYLFSNSSMELIERPYRQFKLMNYFEYAFFSHKMGFAKPSAEAFALVMKKIKICPQNVLFIDDKEKNLLAAKELGFHTYLFKNSEDFPKILVEYNLQANNMHKDELMEYVDETDKVIGILPRSRILEQKKMYRLVAIFVFDSEGKLFIQKRSKAIRRYPGYYESSAGGHIALGESYGQAAVRELYEELGIKDPLKFVGKLKVEYEGASRFVGLYECTTKKRVMMNKEEVSGGNFLALNEISEMLKSKEKFTPVFIKLFNRFYKGENETNNLL